MPALKFHSRTKKLLPRASFKSSDISRLDERAVREGFAVPAAFREWASIGGAEVCRRFSNDDHFADIDAKLIVLPGGRQGLAFAKENQGNFALACLLDGSDDPPVLFAYLGREPWLQYSKRFSDAVFCWLFDWQYMLEFNGDEKEIAYYSSFSLKSKQPIDELVNRHALLPQTEMVSNGKRFLSRRVAFSQDARIVTFESDGTYSIMVCGKTFATVNEAEDELIVSFGTAVEVPTHTCVLFGLLELDRHIQNRRSLAKLKSLFCQSPDDGTLDRLLTFCSNVPLRELRTADWNGPHTSSFVLHIPQIDLQIRLVQVDEFAWNLDTLELCV